MFDVAMKLSRLMTFSRRRKRRSFSHTLKVFACSCLSWSSSTPLFKRAQSERDLGKYCEAAEFFSLYQGLFFKFTVDGLAVNTKEGCTL